MLVFNEEISVNEAELEEISLKQFIDQYNDFPVRDITYFPFGNSRDTFCNFPEGNLKLVLSTGCIGIKSQGKFAVLMPERSIVRISVDHHNSGNDIFFISSNKKEKLNFLVKRK
jgi:hypothetical protein